MRPLLGVLRDQKHPVAVEAAVTALVGMGVKKKNPRRYLARRTTRKR